MAVVGHVKDIHNVMTKRRNIKNSKNKIKHIIKLLRFVSTIDDPEIVKSTIESVIELLEEEISK